MKKLFSLFLLLAIAYTVSAQSTSPRFGTAKNQDNTGRVLTNAYASKTDAAGADSVLLVPNAYQTIYRLSLVDSFYFKSPTVTSSYAGDKLVIVASGASGTKVKFAGTNFISAGTATLSTNGRAVLNFIFDGAKWVESGRVVQ